MSLKSKYGSTTSPINRRKIRLNNMVFGKEVSFRFTILHSAQISFYENDFHGHFDARIVFQGIGRSNTLNLQRTIAILQCSKYV